MSETDKSPEVDTAIASNHDSDGSIDLGGELINLSEVDAVLAKKMALVNAAIDGIGMTPFQWKLFFLNGFGYAVDSVSTNSNGYHDEAI